MTKKEIQNAVNLIVANNIFDFFGGGPDYKEFGFDSQSDLDYAKKYIQQLASIIYGEPIPFMGDTNSCIKFIKKEYGERNKR